MGRRQNFTHHLLGRQIRRHRNHFRPVNHNVGHFQINQIQEAAKHFMRLFLDAAFAVQQINRAAQLFLRRQNRLIFADMNPERSQQNLDEKLDRDRNRPKNRHDHRNRSRKQQSRPVRRIDRQRLRHHFRKNDHSNRHDNGRINHAFRAKKLHQNNR